MDRLWLIVSLTFIINFVNTLSYAVHVSGVATQRMATASSLFNILALFFHMCGGVQAPLLAKSVDDAIARIETGAAFFTEQEVLSGGLHVIIWGAVFGTLAGIFFLPAFTSAFIKLIYLFDELKSVPRLLLAGIMNLKRSGIFKRISLPTVDLLLRNISFHIPFMLILLHMLVTSFYTVSSLAAVYAGFLLPHYRTTVVSIAPLVTGLAGVVLVVMIEPVIASIMDEAMRGQRPFRDVKAMVIYLVFGRLTGVFVSQFLLFPLSNLLVRIVRWF